jgi:hypothetical protein
MEIVLQGMRKSGEIAHRKFAYFAVAFGAHLRLQVAVFIAGLIGFAIGLPAI